MTIDRVCRWYANNGWAVIIVLSKDEMLFWNVWRQWCRRAVCVQTLAMTAKNIFCPFFIHAKWELFTYVITYVSEHMMMMMINNVAAGNLNNSTKQPDNLTLLHFKSYYQETSRVVNDFVLWESNYKGSWVNKILVDYLFPLQRLRSSHSCIQSLNINWK